MKKSLRIITLLMALIMAMSVAASAAGTQATSADSFRYSEKDGAITIDKYVGTATAVVIPEKINGVSVVYIGEDAFANQRSITQVTIPATVKMIYSGAFEGCTALEKVTMLGKTSVLSQAFKGCTSLGSIALNGSSIGKEAFKGCGQLKTVEIGENVTKCDTTAFEGCTALSEIKVSNNNGYFEVNNGVLYSKDNEHASRRWSEKKAVFTLAKASSRPATKRTESSLPAVENVYDESGKITSKTESVYDVSGNLLKKRSYSYESSLGALGLASENTYVYDERGNLLKETVGKWLSSENRYIESYSYKEYKYNASGRLIEETEHYGYEANDYSEYNYKYEYNQQGKMTKKTSCITDVQSSNGGKVEKEEHRGTSVYSYDKNGNYLGATNYDASGKVSGKQELAYDKNNHCVSEKSYDGTTLYAWYESVWNSLGQQTEYRSLDANGKCISKTVYEYDSRGNLLKQKYGTSDSDLKLIESNTYDNSGRLTQKIAYSNGEVYGKYVYKRDAKGNITDYSFYNQGGKVFYQGYKATYDKNGNQLTYQNVGGELTKRTFDGNNNKTSEIIYSAGDLSKVESAEYWTYDAHGNELTYKKLDSAGKVVARRENTYNSFN